jgi:hypothetical protein
MIETRASFPVKLIHDIFRILLVCLRHALEQGQTFSGRASPAMTAEVWQNSRQSARCEHIEIAFLKRLAFSK